MANFSSHKAVLSAKQRQQTLTASIIIIIIVYMQNEYKMNMILKTSTKQHCF